MLRETLWAGVEDARTNVLAGVEDARTNARTNAQTKAGPNQLYFDLSIDGRESDFIILSL